MHQRVLPPELLHRPGPREEPLRRPVLPAELLHQPGRQAGPPRRPVLQPELPLRPVLPAELQHQPGHQHQTILLHRHPDRWDHLLTEAVPREAEVTAEAAELPEVVAAVAGDADRLYYF